MCGALGCVAAYIASLAEALGSSRRCSVCGGGPLAVSDPGCESGGLVCVTLPRDSIGIVVINWRVPRAPQKSQESLFGVASAGVDDSGIP